MTFGSDVTFQIRKKYSFNQGFISQTPVHFGDDDASAWRVWFVNQVEHR